MNKTRENTFVSYRRAVVYYNSKEISVKPLIDQLHFITNKQKWGFMFSRGFFEINNQDYTLIANAMLHERA